LEVIQRQRLPEEFRRHKPMARRPDREIPPWRGMSSPQRSLWLWTAGPEREPALLEPLADPEAGVTPMSDKNKHSTKNAKKDQENAGAIFSWSFADPDFAPVIDNKTDSTTRTKKDKAIMYARGSGPFLGLPCKLYPMDHPSSPVMGYGPPPAPPSTQFALTPALSGAISEPEIRNLRNRDNVGF
ncbi:Hypothetical predicted protein, partial [Lynx pardinus]